MMGAKRIMSFEVGGRLSSTQTFDLRREDDINVP
jgi:hypothetical protein